MINLSQWCNEHPAKAFIYKGKTYDILGRCVKDNTKLNRLQKLHIQGEINLYQPIETYREKWFHDAKVFYPIEGTRRRDDLPPIYLQWKEDYRRRNRTFQVQELNQMQLQLYTEIFY